MEEMNNNINPNQQPQPQKEEEEKKKKNKFVAWWLGLGKWAKVGICAGTAAVLATGITLAIVLPKNKDSSKGHDIPVYITDESSQGYISASDYPAKIKSTDTTFTYKIRNPGDEGGATFELLDQNHTSIPKTNYLLLTTEALEKTITDLDFTNVTSITVNWTLAQ